MTLWLTEADVGALVDLTDAIDALERAFLRLGRGDGFNVPKALATWGDGASMHSLGSSFPDAGLAGFKSWMHSKRGAASVMAVFDALHGRLLAVMQAGTLGQLRTSAIGGLAAKHFSPPRADEMALIGAGSQAATQVAAVASVRPLRRVRVWSRSADKREQMAAHLATALSIRAEAFASVEAAVADAPIVTLMTRATEPVLAGSMLAPGCLLNAFGAILPANAEFHQDVFDRAGLVLIDDIENGRRSSRELRQRFGVEGPWTGVRSLAEALSRGAAAPTDGSITLFKAMGMGLSDLAIAEMALERAKAAGRGMALPVSGRAPLRLRAAGRPIEPAR